MCETEITSQKLPYQKIQSKTEEALKSLLIAFVLLGSARISVSLIFFREGILFFFCPVDGSHWKTSLHRLQKDETGKVISTWGFFGAARALSLATEIKGIDVAFDNVSICQCIYLIDKCICGYDRCSRDPSCTLLNAWVHFNS